MNNKQERTKECHQKTWLNYYVVYLVLRQVKQENTFTKKILK